MRVRGGDDAGVFAVLYAVLVVTLAVVVGLVVDLGMMRHDRRTERLAADAAAAAGGLTLSPLAGRASARAACIAAWTYAIDNLPDADPGATSPCGAVPDPAPAGCPAADGRFSATSGAWRITITWPVVNTSVLMTRPNVRPAAAGLTQPVIPSDDVDGVDPCLRIGVTIARQRDFAFATAGGFGSGVTENSSVALNTPDGGEGQEVPLVVLDRSACNVITTGGDGAVARVRNAGSTPGRIAVDSDASGGSGSDDCNTGGRRVAAVNGNGAKIVAWNGDSGLRGVIWGNVRAFQYPGDIGLGRVANRVDICKNSTDPQLAEGICPHPIKRAKPVRRNFVDWTFNCRGSYTDPVRSNPSDPCMTGGGAHIDDLRARYRAMTAATAAAAGLTVLPPPVGTVDPLGFVWTAGDRADWCGDADLALRDQVFYSVPAGSYYIDCDVFQARHGFVQFEGGTLVFRGSLDVSAGCLLLNTGATAATAGSTCATTSEPAVLAPMTVYVQHGFVRRQNASWIAPQVMLYQQHDENGLTGADAVGACYSGPSASDCFVSLGNGTSSTVLWTAPKSGNFARLALWSEAPGGNSSSTQFSMGAQTNAGFIGTFFAPNAPVTFSGQPAYFASDAQFVVWRLVISGGALLELTPNPLTTVLVPSAGVRLIR